MSFQLKDFLLVLKRKGGECFVRSEKNVEIKHLVVV